MSLQRAHPLISTIFVRTLMDSRYFHGIRVTAARLLVKHAKDEVDWIGLVLYPFLQRIWEHENNFLIIPHDFGRVEIGSLSRPIADRSSYSDPFLQFCF